MLYDIDYNSAALFLAVKPFEGDEWQQISAIDIAGWLFEKGHAQDWHMGAHPRTGQPAAIVKLDGWPAIPVQDWLKSLGADADELIVCYMDSIGDWNAALLLTKSQQQPERPAEQFTEKQKANWLISIYEID
jgi:hypothetical protein